MNSFQYDCIKFSFYCIKFIDKKMNTFLVLYVHTSLQSCTCGCYLTLLISICVMYIKQDDDLTPTLPR